MNQAMILVLCVTVLFVTDSTPKRIVPHVLDTWKNVTDLYQNDCLGVSPMISGYSENMNNNAELPNDRSFGCHIKCLYKKIGVLKPDDEFDFNAILDTLTYMNEEVTRKCIDESESQTDACLKSLIFGKCVVNTFSIE
ncbi:hypothetical protein FQR65_LT00478 [Abscondita terminalis]|nr:hypothetical protein FQR65_LT00478 [Abscondita terminalis]